MKTAVLSKLSALIWQRGAVVPSPCLLLIRKTCTVLLALCKRRQTRASLICLSVCRSRAVADTSYLSINGYRDQLQWRNRSKQVVFLPRQQVLGWERRGSSWLFCQILIQDLIEIFLHLQFTFGILSRFGGKPQEFWFLQQEAAVHLT